MQMGIRISEKTNQGHKEHSSYVHLTSKDIEKYWSLLLQSATYDNTRCDFLSIFSKITVGVSV